VSKIRTAFCISHFLTFKIVVAVLFVSAPSLAITETQSGAEWVTSVDEPGPDAPPIGRSLFDYLFTDRSNGQSKYYIPFPFEDLTDALEVYLQSTTTRPLQKVLIPLGRSLQRNAASPHFFKFPRAIVVAEANPISIPGKPLIVLKDRLFLGYQPQAEAIEIISYNEKAGRFEFQVVENYSPSGTPKVYYANRSTCLGCHQNHAPIFAVQPWDESNSNPSVSTLLMNEQKSFYGIPSFTGIDIPGLIGFSADRANLFSTYQLIWKEGCNSSSGADSVNCRAQALFAALRYRLAANTHAGTRKDLARATLSEQFRLTWAQKWPIGLAIPSRELVDMDPFGGAKTYLGVGAVRDLKLLENLVPPTSISIDDKFEPLYPRGPLEVWGLPKRVSISAGMEPRWLNKFVAGLGDFLVPQDIERLDAALIEVGGSEIQYKIPCEIQISPDILEDTIIRFSCRDENKGPNLLAAQGRIQFTEGNFVDGLVENIQIPPYGSGVSMKLLAVETSLAGADRRLDMEGRAANDGASLGQSGRHPRLNARLPSGELIKRIVLEWQQTGEDSLFEGMSIIKLVDDIEALRLAIQKMADMTETGLSDALGYGSFRRAVLLPEVLTNLGVESGDWCCVHDTNFPAVEVAGD
jgi:hypothetical protein